MRITKFAQIAKKKGYIVWINSAKGVYLSQGNAIYKAQELPAAEGEGQIGAILDIDAKKMAKMSLHEEYASSDEDVCGLNMSDFEVPGECQTEQVKMAAVINGMYYSCLKCSDGELVFYDDTLLLPISDKLKDEVSYVRFYTRQHKTAGEKYIVVKDGFQVIAAIMPKKIISDDYIDDLQDFLFTCKGQLDLDKEKEREKKKQEPEGCAETLSEVILATECQKAAAARMEQVSKETAEENKTE